MREWILVLMKVEDN